MSRYFNENNNAEKLQVMLSGCLSDMCRVLAECGDDNTAKRIIEYERNRDEKIHFETITDPFFVIFANSLKDLKGESVSVFNNKNANGRRNR